MSRVHAALAAVRGSADALLAGGVLAIVLLLVAPLPPAALDALLAVNLAASATVLVVTLLARSALGFATFPALLLVTTLFRLALAVSSTRLVLSRGEAGRAAARIRAAARRAGVPVVRDAPLARALHRLAEVGDEIPEALYEAAAVVLARLYGAEEVR